MSLSRLYPQPTLVDPTLARIVLLFRLLGWLWMVVLVGVGLAAEPGTEAHIGNESVAVTALAVATIWTALTVYSVFSERFMWQPWFVVIDFVLAAGVGVASVYGDTAELFHGGYPMSFVLVAAYAGGTRWALPAALVLGVEQWFVRLEMGRSLSGAIFAVVFPVLGAVAGFAFDALREHSTKRSEAEALLAESMAQQARLEERAELANQLHDSVIQTLHAIRMEASDPSQVVYLARRQERELKKTIDQFLSPYQDSFRVALLTARDDVEDMHRVEVDAVVTGDIPLTDDLQRVVDAVREAMLNAARHSGADRIDVFAMITDDRFEVTIRDRGSGFEPGETLAGGGHGLAKSVVARVERIGGEVTINSSPGEGTEIIIVAPHRAAGNTTLQSLR